MAHDDGSRLAARLGAYIGGKLGSPITIGAIEAIAGGASRATFRLGATYAVDGEPRDLALILRLDPTTSLIETERRAEFAALRAFFRSAVPVPEPLWLEEDPGVLGSPFFIMAEVTGAEANPLRLMQPPFAAHRARTGQQKWTILGEIARTDIATRALDETLAAPAPAGCWQRELDHWVAVLDADELEPQPIARAAIRWLRRHPPPPAQRISVVHGDYRTGNILVDPAGTIRAVLDWEMVHLGDPLEDLAWGLNRVWSFGREGLAGGLLPKVEAIAIWERASGLVADRAALHWWEVFSCIKGQAIWLSAAKAFQSGGNRDSIMAIAAWMQTNAQDRATQELLAKLGAAP